MLSKEKQIENLLVAQAMFKDIPASKVDLGLWTTAPLRCAVLAGEDPVHTCGSTACFGGWIALHPHFQAQGVRPDHEGVPRIPDSGMDTYALSYHLFGNSVMFSACHWASSASYSDRQEIFARIERALNELLES